MGNKVGVYIYVCVCAASLSLPSVKRSNCAPWCPLGILLFRRRELLNEKMSRWLCKLRPLLSGAIVLGREIIKYIQSVTVLSWRQRKTSAQEREREREVK